MKKTLRFGLVAVAAVMMAAPVQAHWYKRADCGPVVPVTYVDQKVTAYRCVTKEREVEILVNKMVPKDVDFTYTELTRVTEPTTVIEHYCEKFEEKVPFKYFVDTLVTTQEKVIQHYCERVEEPVPFKYIVHQTETVPEKRTITRYICVPVEKSYKVTTMQLVTTPEKRKVIEYKEDRKEVEYTYTEMCRPCSRKSGR